MMTKQIKLAAVVTFAALAAIFTEIPTAAALGRGADGLPRTGRDTTEAVRGRVLGPDSLPVSRALVTITAKKTGKRKVTRTDATGKFAIMFADTAREHELVVLVV